MIFLVHGYAHAFVKTNTLLLATTLAEALQSMTGLITYISLIMSYFTADVYGSNRSVSFRAIMEYE